MGPPVSAGAKARGGEVCGVHEAGEHATRHASAGAGGVAAVHAPSGPACAHSLQRPSAHGALWLATPVAQDVLQARPMEGVIRREKA